jgi:hypothetical protein
MSARNTLEAKRARRARRTLTKGVLPAYINLIEWVKLRSGLSTRQAQNVLLHGSLRVDSHPVGYVEENGKKFLKVLIPAEMRDRIQIVEPEALKNAS